MTLCEFPCCSWTCFSLDCNALINNILPEQPWYVHALVKLLMSSIAFVQRWWLLPRLSPGIAVDVRLVPNVTADGTCPRLYPSEILFKYKVYDLIRSSYSSVGKLGPGTSLRGLVSDIIKISSSSLSDGTVKCLDLSEYPISLPPGFLSGFTP